MAEKGKQSGSESTRSLPNVGGRPQVLSQGVDDCAYVASVDGDRSTQGHRDKPTARHVKRRAQVTLLSEDGARRQLLGDGVSPTQ